MTETLATAANPPTHAKRLDWLDSCRAIAALLVVAMHTIEVWRPLVAEHDVVGQAFVRASDTLAWGVMGVYLFFLVSGFIIAYSVKALGPRATRDFLIRWFFRLMPLLWLSIPLGAITTHWLWHKPFGLGDAISNAVLIPNFLGRPFAEGL